MSEAEIATWVRDVTALSDGYHKDLPPLNFPYEVDTYLAKGKSIDYSKFITPMWQEHYDRAEALLLRREERFLEDDMMRYSFFLTGGSKWQDLQLDYLRSKWKQSELARLLKEDHVFYPTISSAEYHTSECLVHHLTHFTVFQEKLNFDWSKLKTVVEFGGGYGGMCRLLRRLAPGTTHVIIDLPIFLFFQQFFFRNIFGNDAVNLILDENGTIVEGKINLVPVTFKNVLRNLQNLSPDLFIATWSLSEANEHTVKYVTDMDYFQARNLLMAYRHYDSVNPRQPCSDSLTLTSNYNTVYRGDTFYALAAEQHYFFARRN